MELFLFCMVFGIIYALWKNARPVDEIDDDPKCTGCGHRESGHLDRGFYRPCLRYDCDCEDYENDMA